MSKSKNLSRGCKKISDEISMESLDSECEIFGLIVYSDKHHVEYIYPLLLQIETVLRGQDICPKRLGADIRSSEDYLDTLESLVDDSSLVVIILDGFRPNVLFEFGYALSKRKPIIILKSADATINIKTLFRTTADSGLTNRNFGFLRNPTLDVSFHLSDFGGKHILKIDWKAKESDSLFPPTVLRNELNKKKNEIIQESTRIRTKELPSPVPMDVLELVIEVFGFYYSKEKVSIEKVKKLYMNLKELAETYDMKPPIKIYDMLSSIYSWQHTDALENLERISYLIEAQKINNDILALLSGKGNYRARILMRNGEISQKILFYSKDKKHGYKAIKSFKEAIEIFSRSHLNRDIAFAQNGIGQTYLIMAKIENTGPNLKEAIKFYLKALKVFTRQDFLQEFVYTQFKLGLVYYELSEVENQIDNLKKSIEIMDEVRKLGYLKLALTGYLHDIQNLLGMLHSNLGEALGSNEEFEKAFEFYQDALRGCSFDKEPELYATVQNNLGVYYGQLVKAGIDSSLKQEYVKKSIDCFNKALEVITFEKSPINYFDLKTNLCEMYRKLGEIENNANHCNKAIENCNQALSVELCKNYPNDFARAQFNLGSTYDTLAELENPIENLNKSIQCFNEFQKVMNIEIDAEFYARGQKRIGDVYKKIYDIDKQKTICKKALEAYKTALKVYHSIGHTENVTEIQEIIDKLSVLCNE